MNARNSENKIAPDEFNRMNSEEKILKMAGGLQPISGRPEKEVLESILNNIERTVPKKKISLKQFLQAVAAFVIFLVSVYTIQTFLKHEKEITKFAEHSEIILPDGTIVTLNAASKLTWDDKKFNSKRSVTLNGEAYFNVKKGDEFIINTKKGTIEILGTKLNVFSRENNFWVSCIAGKVRVSANNQQQTITPGELVKLSEGSLVITTSEDIERTISWKSGLFHFEDTELNTIFDEMERQFNVSIQFNGDGKRKATIDFSNKNLNEALDIVCIPMELNYEIQNKKKVTVSDTK